MSPEAILTVLTVVLAVLALIPEERRQDLRIRLGGSATLVMGLATLLILYWSLLEPLHALPGLRRLPRVLGWLQGWAPASSSVAVVLIATGYCLAVYRRRIPASRLSQLSRAFSGALARRRLGECAHLVSAHLKTIRVGIEGNYWQLRFRKRLMPTTAELHRKALVESGQRSEGVTVPKQDGDPSEALGRPPFVFPREPKERPRWVQPLVARAEAPEDAAHDIVRSISLSPPLVRHFAAADPYLGLELSLLPSSWLAREFTESFAEALIADPDSVFYRELRRAENLDRHNVPLVDNAEQPLLAALCEDSLRPDGPKLLYTFLDACIQPLRTHLMTDLRRELNGPIGDYYERTRWFSPPFGCVYLLEITAPRNAVSSEAQHINLYALDLLVGALLQQLSPSDDVDLGREWPTPTHYLCYEAVSLLVDLVGIWRDRPSDLPESKLSKTHDGLPYILPAQAIDVLGSVMKALLSSRKLDGRFKGYLLSVWWRAYWEKYKKPWAQTETVLERLVTGGPYAGGETSHREGLAAALTHVDIVQQVSEGADRIREAFGLPPR